jgi:hypothetical protein
VINIHQLRELIIKPSLQQTGLYSPEAELLMIGTALVESNLSFLAQRPTPIARSIWMIEQPTYTDLRIRLIGNKGLAQKILDCLWMDDFPQNYDYLSGNLTAACLFARLKYWFSKEHIPIPGNAQSLAGFWARIYNTRNLDSDKKRFIELFNKYVD